MTGRRKLVWKLLPLYALLAAIPFATHIIVSAFAKGNESADVLRLTFMLAGMLSGVAVFLVIWNLHKSIESIKTSAGRFASGDLGFRLQLPPSEEMASLAVTLNQMASQLAERIAIIESQSRQVETILRSMAEGVIATGRDGIVVKANDAVATLFSTNGMKLEGRKLAEIIRDHEFNRLASGVLNSGNPDSFEMILSKPEGDRHIYTKFSPLKDSAGRSTGVVIVLSDVTRLRKLEQARKEFVANVSHELKTPLTSIKGFVETLLEGALQEPDEARRFCEIISTQVDRLQAIIEDLLSLSRIEQEVERGQVKLALHRIDNILQAAAGEVELKAKEKNIALSFGSQFDCLVNAHATLLEQAFVNLLDNAIKYSEPGKTIRLETLQSADGMVRINVHDEGIGIPNEHLEHIFDRFYRVDKARSRKQGGTGLGLSIVQRIISAHNGDVSVSSVYGRGSTFSVRLPIQPGD